MSAAFQRKSLTVLAAALAISSPAVLAGCSSVLTTIENDPANNFSDGVVYYMPRRPIKVTVTVPPVAAKPAAAGAEKPADAAGAAGKPADAAGAAGKPAEAAGAAGKPAAAAGAAGKPADVTPTVPVPSIDTVDATADVRQRFVLKYQENFVGKNHLKIGVSANGLLNSSNAETTSGITTIVQNIAKAIGSAEALAIEAAIPPGEVPPPPPPSSCQAGRAYTVLIYPELNTTGTLCGFSITLTNLDGSPIVNASSPNAAELTAPQPFHRPATNASHSGLFYKINLPYLVTIQDPNGGPTSQFIGFSPDLSPVAFVPVTPTLFSNNQTNITLSDGTVTGVDASVDGEIVALTELPADFISAYATAIGQLLTAFGNNAQLQTTLLNNQLALTNATAVDAVKKAACQSVIAANEVALSPANIAGATGDALAKATANITTAMANIKAACS